MSSTVQYTGWLQAYSTVGWILVYILQGVGYWSTVRWIWVHSGVDVGQQGVDTVLYTVGWKLAYKGASSKVGDTFL